VIRKPDGTYLPAWRNMVAKGRARKRAARPKRDILAVKIALENLKLAYYQEVSFWNPYHVGKHGNLDGGLQWVDFVVVKGDKMLALILDDPSKRWKDYEKVAHANKLKGLAERVPFVVLPARYSSQEYQILIFMNMRKKGV
jgi:hypothetical protein